jgi:ADP-heptose:LPS heptosyltransferase
VTDPHLPQAVVERLERGGRLLVTCLDNLGDLVFASALLPPLRERFPRARITLWCKAYAAEVGALVPNVDELVASDPFWDKAPGRGKGRLAPFARAAIALRRARFDAALLSFAPWRTAAAVAALGVPVRVARARHRNRPFLTHILPPEDKGKPVLAELAHLLVPFGIPLLPLRYRLNVEPLAERRERIAPLVGERTAVLHAFASKRNRCVAPNEWIALADALAARGRTPLWIGSPTELAELRALSGARAEWLWSDELLSGSLSDLMAAISLSSLFVGHDSGPLHVAGAFGVPVVGIFAPGEPRRTFPQGIGPSRMIARASPSDIGAADMLAAAEALGA